MDCIASSHRVAPLNGNEPIDFDCWNKLSVLRREMFAMVSQDWSNAEMAIVCSVICWRDEPPGDRRNCLTCFAKVEIGFNRLFQAHAQGVHRECVANGYFLQTRQITEQGHILKIQIMAGVDTEA